MLKKLDETLPLAETSSLANADLAGRFYLASRGVPDYLTTLARRAAADTALVGVNTWLQPRQFMTRFAIALMTG